MISAEEALQRLIRGNKEYLKSGKCNGRVDDARRAELVEGQHPYAVVVSCSDSRVVPEAVFSAGLGELFVIRVAGNVVGEHELGSIEYAADHLGAPLVVVLGHTHCGAVAATLAGEAGGHVGCLIDAIRGNIGTISDERQASCENARAGARCVKEVLGDSSVTVLAALYDIESGEVIWL